MYTRNDGIQVAKIFTLSEKDKLKYQAGFTKKDYLVGIGYDISKSFELNAGMATNKDDFKDNELYIGASYNFKF